MTETEHDIPFEEPAPGLDDGDGEGGDQGEPEEGTELGDGAEAEPDEDDAEAAATAEREAELAAERQQEAQSIEAQQREQDAKRKKLDQLAGHVAKRYGEILGPDLDGWVGCPLCAQGYPGIRLPIMPDYETVSAVKVAIGEDPDPPLINDHYSKVCEDCVGLGKVLTGSKVSGQATATCIPCKGRGWVSIGPEREQGNLIATNGTTTTGGLDTSTLPADTAAAVEALRALNYIVVEPIATPEALAAQGG